MRKVLTTIALVAAVGACPPAAHGQHVHKCVSGSQVSYQSDPCSHPRQLAGQWDATPEAQADALAAPASSSSPRPTAARRPQASNAGSSRPPSARRSARASTAAPARGAKACRAARAHRDATERKLGLKRDYQTLQALNQQVREACR